MKPGETYGKWTLVGDRAIGEGGNSIVWKARADDEEEVAIKFLTRFDRYARFRDEVDFQIKNANQPGLLPLLGSHLPEVPSKSERPWLVTPFAIPIREFVEQSSDKFETAVKCIREIAYALATVHSLGGAHRDVKPENMFVYKCRAVIGDFGLVAYVGKSSKTETGERLGPIHYVSPELLGNQDGHHDSRLGDVYSLAKALWVLATGQRYPLPGNLDAMEPACRLSSYLNHDRAVLLERLMDTATAVTPNTRPSCFEFAEELSAGCHWLASAFLVEGLHVN